MSSVGAGSEGRVETPPTPYSESGELAFSQKAVIDLNDEQDDAPTPYFKDGHLLFPGQDASKNIKYREARWSDVDDAAQVCMLAFWNEHAAGPTANPGRYKYQKGMFYHWRRMVRYAIANRGETHLIVAETNAIGAPLGSRPDYTPSLDDIATLTEKSARNRIMGVGILELFGGDGPRPECLSISIPGRLVRFFFLRYVRLYNWIEEKIVPNEAADEKREAMSGYMPTALKYYRTKQENTTGAYDRFIYVNLLAVRPKFQGNGVGLNLLSRFNKIADQMKMPSGVVSADKKESFYAKRGFVKIGNVVTDCPGSPFEGIRGGDMMVREPLPLKSD